MFWLLYNFWRSKTSSTSRQFIGRQWRRTISKRKSRRKQDLHNSFKIAEVPWCCNEANLNTVRCPPPAGSLIAQQLFHNQPLRRTESDFLVEAFFLRRSQTSYYFKAIANILCIFGFCSNIPCCVPNSLQLRSFKFICIVAYYSDRQPINNIQHVVHKSIVGKIVCDTIKQFSHAIQP